MSRFGSVDAFPFSIVQPSDVSVINATFVANISNNTPSKFTYVSRVWIGVQANSSAYATALDMAESRRHLQTQGGYLAAEAANSYVHGIKGRSRELLQSLDAVYQALDTKLLALIASFKGASPCNGTEIANAYYNGSSPVLDGDRPYRCVSYPVQPGDAINTYLSTYSAVWPSLPHFTILDMDYGPTAVRYTPRVDVNSLVVADIDSQAQLLTVRQAGWQQQLACINQTLMFHLALHQLTAVVDATLAFERQVENAQVATAVYEELLLRKDHSTNLLTSQLSSFSKRNFSRDGVPVSFLHGKHMYIWQLCSVHNCC